MKRSLLVILIASVLALAGCDSYGSSSDGGSSGQSVDPTPERLDGSESQEFGDDDIAQAESASEEVQDYCSGAVSEAQEAGCLSHVEDGDIP